MSASAGGGMGGGMTEQASSSSDISVSTPGNKPVRTIPTETFSPLRTETEHRVVPLENLPKTTNVFRTSKGVSLHFRYHLPVSSKKIESIVFLIHGYGGHSNSQRTLKIAENFLSYGRAVFLLDLIGHGYSEGERALFTRHQDLVEDIYEFISVVSGLTSTSQHKTGFECGMACIFPSLITTSEPTITWDIGSARHDAIKRVPFYIMGNSLGGALGVFLAPRLFGNVKFRGLILLAPSLDFKMPSTAITGLLEVTFATFSPNEVMPDWIMGPRESQPITWKEEVVKEQVEQDKWGLPGALGWGHNMKWATGLMFIRMAEALKTEFSSVRCPFVILHDPYDKVANIKGSHELLERSHTSPDQKTLVEVPGFFHSMLLTNTDEVCEIVNEWISRYTLATPLSKSGSRTTTPSSRSPF